MELVKENFIAFVTSDAAHILRGKLARAKSAHQHIAAHVAAYTAPMFKAAGFPAEIKTADDLYLCEDDAKCAAFYAAMDTAHRRNGYTVPAGYCPALMAHTAIRETEGALLSHAANAGLPDFRAASMELRQKALDTLAAPITGQEQRAKDGAWHAKQQAVHAAAQMALTVPHESAAEFLPLCDWPYAVADAPGALWTRTSERAYWNALECVPPAAQRATGFLCGEPANHTANNEPVYSAFFIAGAEYFHAYATRRQFIAAVHCL